MKYSIVLALVSSLFLGCQKDSNPEAAAALDNPTPPVKKQACTQAALDAYNFFAKNFKEISDLKNSRDVLPLKNSCETMEKEMGQEACLAQEITVPETFVAPGTTLELSFADVRERCDDIHKKYAEKVDREEKLAREGRLPLKLWEKSIGLRLKAGNEGFFKSMLSGQWVMSDWGLLKHDDSRLNQTRTCIFNTFKAELLNNIPPESETIVLDKVLVEELRVILQNEDYMIICSRNQDPIRVLPNWTLSDIQSIFGGVVEFELLN